MPKTIYTPRDELVCGKLDLLEDKLRELGLVECLYLTGDIRHDCERMEAKLIERKKYALPYECVRADRRKEMENEELKPCPFCGGEAYRKVNNDILTVGCQNCLISFANHVRFGCMADAEWNTRA